MNLFGVNIVLALCWGALTESFYIDSLLVGFVVGFAALWVASPLYTESPTYFLSVIRAIRLALYFVFELIMSSLKVAWTILFPSKNLKSAIVRMPLDVKDDIEILLVTNLISLTPGTLSLDVSPDRSTLYVHAMFADDPDALVVELKSGMERLVKEVFEGV